MVALVRSKKSLNVNNLKKLKIGIKYIGNLSKEIIPSKEYHKAKYLIHLAASAHVKEKMKEDKKKKLEYLINIEKNLAKSFSNPQLKVIHLSSAKTVFLEDKYKRKEANLYVKAKLKSENIIKKNFKNYIILRPPLIYGPRVKANFLNLMKAIDAGLPLPFGSINNQRSYLYVENLIDAIDVILKKNKIKRKTYLISDNEIMSTPQLCLEISKGLFKKSRIFHIRNSLLKFFFKLIGKNDLLDKISGNFIIKNDEFCKDFSWKPNFNASKGIEKTCFWFKRK